MLPRLSFVPEDEACPECGRPLTIQKTRRRTVVTLTHGAFEAHEVPKICVAGHGGSKGSEALRRLVRPGQRWGYDVIVKVELRRYLAGELREAE